jgi:hypothetical protein
VSEDPLGAAPNSGPVGVRLEAPAFGQPCRSILVLGTQLVHIDPYAVWWSGPLHLGDPVVMAAMSSVSSWRTAVRSASAGTVTLPTGAAVNTISSSWWRVARSR